MKLKFVKSFLLSSAILGLPLGAQEPTLHPSLLKAASKIDLSASFIELNDARTDVETLKKYGGLIMEALKQMDPSTPQFDISQLIDETGLGTINATATSNTKSGDLWLNKIYVENGGSRKGLFSIIGGDAKEFSVPAMCPAGTDVALQLEIHLDQVPGILRSIAGLFEMEDEAEQGLNEAFGPFAMTNAQFLEKFQATLNLAVDFDENFNAQFVGRLDGLSWIWDEQFEKFFEGSLKDMGLTFRQAKFDGHETYEVLSGMEELSMVGTRPFLLIDKAQNQIWLASSKEYLELSKSAKTTLKDDPEFVKTWSGMPQTGNSMAYFSNDILKQAFAMGEMFLLPDAEEDNESSFEGGILLQALAELIPAESGIALSIARDEDGALASAKIPMASKHLEWISTQAVTLLPMMFFSVTQTSEMTAFPSDSTLEPMFDEERRDSTESHETLPALPEPPKKDSE